jgi:hypothetical protein
MKHLHFPASLALMFTLVGMTGMSGCAPSQREPSGTRLLVIGVDGLEWDILLPLMERGELPHLQNLLTDGVGGRLETLEPTLSPVIWTTIATGKTPAAHGITDFTWTAPSGETRLFTSRQRRVPALWTMASASDRQVDVIGWWNTWPAEAIQGHMVSQFSSLDQGKRVWKGTVHEGVPAQTWPEDLYDTILPMVRETAAEYPDLADDGTPGPGWSKLFPTLPQGMTPLEQRLVEDSMWAFRADATYTAIARSLLTENPADLTMVYLGSPDVAGHRFFRHYRPDAYAHTPRAEALSAFQDVIPATYRFIDHLVGQLVAAAPPGTGIVILSDHGMRPVNTDKDFEWAFENSEQYRLAAVNSGHHLAGEAGVLMAAGPPFAGRPLRPGAVHGTDLPRVASVFDLTPTLLHLLGLKVGADLPGQVLVDLLATDGPGQDPVRYTESYDHLLEEDPGGAFQGLDEERLRQLKSLGYVE